MLYQRPIESWRLGRVRLCPVLAEGEPPEPGASCPQCGDSKVVCPNGFWGYGKVIEQLPYRRGRQAGPRKPPVQIGGDPPVRLDACTFVDFYHRPEHLAALRGLADEERWRVLESNELEAVEQVLRSAGQRTDVLYFYAHGGEDDRGHPYLEIGHGLRLGENEFDAWDVSFEGRRPLVILNVCDSAHYGPESFENLIQVFCERGASGVVATQCEIRELLADAVGRDFLRRLLRSEAVGPALLASRRTLLRGLDPRGLVYSLFADAELRLAGVSNSSPSSEETVQ